MHKVFVKELKIFAYHGVEESERANGAYFLLDIEVETDFSKAAAEDNLHYTIDYGKLCRIAEEQMYIPSMLLEHVAQRIVNAIYASFSGIKKVRICLQKLNAPIQAEIFSAGVVIEK